VERERVVACCAVFDRPRCDVQCARARFEERAARTSSKVTVDAGRCTQIADSSCDVRVGAERALPKHELERPSQNAHASASAAAARLPV